MLDYNPVRLKGFFTYVKPENQFTFVHFYKQFDSDIISQPQTGKARYIEVKGYSIKSETEV